MKKSVVFLVNLVLASVPALAQEPAGPAQDAARKTEIAASDLVRKAVITVEGDEIGVVRNVGYSEKFGEAVAVVALDAFVGVGDKAIAIPLSRLRADPGSDSVMTTLTREAIEAEETFDEAGLAPIG